ncbi:hypothetical protein HUZ36_16200 [Pseudoalteromonas sp. McH1-7]|uniref:tetratricopeptide repeat protein n=1 Tax=unclassified Pseudoalteromonas TaxID=194690 RepID=UPI0015901DDA|nr:MULTISPECIES: hypothetical protein [unclassified Pseudoalteromonas]NUZ12326.1 hypothetical protein [Pseudoalteromonas sp. McH1-7]USD28397.1 hypothetical protein J8Z24_16035 [Pseudoalteromonas sp. SCSIO 43201]
MKWLFVVLTAIGLLGCSSTPTSSTADKPSMTVASLFNHTLFTPQPVVSEQAIFSLPQSEVQALWQYVEKHKNSDITIDELLGNFLQNKIGDFSYDGATFIAKDALSQRSGNCISLAIVSQAYANVLGIKTSYAKVDSYPVYQKNKSFVLTSSHFKTKLITPREQENDSMIFFSSGTIIDYFPNQDSVFSGNANYADLVAKFYTNLAVSALLAADYDKAYSLLMAALEYAPNDPETINISALLHKHVGDRVRAKQIYAYAAQQQLTSTNLLLNYLNYIPADQTALRESILAQLERSPASPFDTLTLASSYIDKQNYSKAKKLIEPLLLNYHYLPEIHAELGKIAYLEGNLQAALVYFDQAINKSRETYKKTLYSAKQNMLTQLMMQ